MKTITAKILADSISPEGHRLTTLEATYPRFVHSELMTHRVFSRNAASSRAVPFSKKVQEARDNPAMPVVFSGEQRGMQGNERAVINGAETAWLKARGAAVEHAIAMADMGVHKSIVNRIIEPYTWITTLMSATDWDGFWEQRCSDLAQPEIRVAAEAMKFAYDNSVPQELNNGEWHTPLIQDDEDDEFWINKVYADTSRLDDSHPLHKRQLYLAAGLRKSVSAARCARVSYLTHDGKRDISADLELYDRLVKARPPHFSPLEHVATPCDCGTCGSGEPTPVIHQGNFTGWGQLRHLVT